MMIEFALSLLLIAIFRKLPSLQRQSFYREVRHD